MDVPKVAKSLPGVESVSKIDDTTYEGALTVRVGPIKLNLQGKIILEEQNKTDWRAALRAEAKDRMAAGAVNGKTIMNLKEIDANQTELLVETDVNILGKIGEFGQPIIRKKADAMLKEFVENIKKQLSANNGSPPFYRIILHPNWFPSFGRERDRSSPRPVFFVPRNYLNSGSIRLLAGSSPVLRCCAALTASRNAT